MTSKLMVKSETALSSASILLDAGDADGAVSRAHYAMYDAARATIDWAGLTPPDQSFKTHSGLIGYFGLHLVKTGKIPVEIGKSFSRVNELRSIADYLAEPVPLDKAVKAVEEAKFFVEQIRYYMQQTRNENL